MGMVEGHLVPDSQITILPILRCIRTVDIAVISARFHTGFLLSTSLIIARVELLADSCGHLAAKLLIINGAIIGIC